MRERDEDLLKLTDRYRMGTNMAYRQFLFQINR